jgi:5-(carboxyamino)imidazole ribonucleotide synthase
VTPVAPGRVARVARWAASSAACSAWRRRASGYRVAVLDPASDGPAASVADRHIHADYLEPAGLARLAALAAAATTEFENVPAAALEFLSRTARVTPSATSVAIAQDRISEKTFLAGNGFAVAPHAVLRSADDAARVDPALLPGHRQERAPRLRRQGPGARAAIAEVAQRSTAWDASRACSSASSTSPARSR